ncbi:MAG: hypothetical protein RLZZ59_814 [Pseudomonadota bacterium]|jgi:ankyrin repeat protein
MSRELFDYISNRDEKSALELLNAPSGVTHIHAKNKHGLKTLFLAVEKELPAVVEKLLSLGADPNEGDGEFSPLHVAALSLDHGSVMTSALIQYGGNIRELDTYDATPLHAAASKNNIDTIKVILNSLQGRQDPELLNTQDKNKYTALDYATKYPEFQATARVLLDSGATIELQHLLHAAYFGNIEAVKYIDTQNHSLLSGHDDHGDTCLHYAALGIVNNHIDNSIMAELKTLGAIVSANTDGCFPADLIDN